MAGDGNGATRGFWGSRDTEGNDVMVNLRLVAYARPCPAGTALVFTGGVVLEVTTSFRVTSKRLYAAFDEGSAAGGGGDGDDES